jgi:hypothetical protein
MRFEPFPDRRPAFMRAPIPPFDPRQKLALKDFVEPAPVPYARWSWWCIENERGKKTVCLHVQYGHRECEARWDVDPQFYHDNIVRVVRKPITEHDFREVRMGIWNEIADKTETWPKLAAIVTDLERYVYEKHGLDLSRGRDEQETAQGEK